MVARCCVYTTGDRRMSYSIVGGSRRSASIACKRMRRCRVLLARLSSIFQGRSTGTSCRARRLIVEMFLLVLIGVAVLEVFAFIEVGHAIGWLPAVVLLLGTSVFGARMLLAQGRLAIQHVSLALSERRAPGHTAIDGAIGFLGGTLLLIPGFVTDVLGALLLLPLIQRLTRRWMSRHYAGRMMSFVAAAGRFAPGGHAGRPADVESTLVEDDPDQLGR